MISTAQLKPLQRQALRAAFASPDHALKRCRGGYAAPGGDVFTVRTINGLHADGLLLFVPPQFPSHVSLTASGRALAQELAGPGTTAPAAAPRMIHASGSAEFLREGSRRYTVVRTPDAGAA